MAGLLKRIFGKRDGSAPEGSPDIDDMLDWSPGPPPPPPSFRVTPPPPPPPPPPASAPGDLSTQVLWGAPPPPPEPEPSPVVHNREPRVRLMLADGSMLHPSATPEWEGRISYLARNLFPPGPAPTAPRPPKVRLMLADGSVVEELGERMQYLAENLLPARKTRL
jgi:hypothetical protein